MSVGPHTNVERAHGGQPPNLALQRTRPAATLPGQSQLSLGGPDR